MISSTSNPQIKNIIQLQKKPKARVEQGAFVIEGIKMFEESLAGGYLIKAYFSESFYLEKQETNAGYFSGYPYEIVGDSVFKEISDTLTPQGVMAMVRKPEYSMENMIDTPSASLVLLEDIRDPGNLGTILRTAEAAGVTGVILSQTSVDMYNSKVIRSTMGAIYRMPFIYAKDFDDTIKQLRDNNFTIYAAHLSATHYYDEVDYSGKCAVMIGNEANGLSDGSTSLATQYIKIPMEGKVESLNAAVAASILMYEMHRHKRK
jgi:TrmH family RNA methyltransferase